MVEPNKVPVTRALSHGPENLASTKHKLNLMRHVLLPGRVTQNKAGPDWNSTRISERIGTTLKCQLQCKVKVK